MIFIGCDHGGVAIKKSILSYLDKKKYQFEDISESVTSSKPVDYPNIATAVAKKVKKTPDSFGILICGSGTGMAIAANRIKGIRAAQVYDTYSAQMSRIDNNANIIALRGRDSSPRTIIRLLDTWLHTPFSKKSRHTKRIALLDA